MCTIWASKAQFLAILDPKVSKNSGFWPLSQKVFTGFTSVLLHMLIASNFRCVENMGLEGPIFGSTLGPKMSKDWSLWYFSQKISTGFTSVLVYMSIWTTCRQGWGQLRSWSWVQLQLRSWSWNWSWNLRSWSWSWSWYSRDLLELELELELKLPELELELELIFTRLAGVGVGVGVETPGVGVGIGVETLGSWSWNWSGNFVKFFIYTYIQVLFETYSFKLCPSYYAY